MILNNPIGNNPIRKIKDISIMIDTLHCLHLVLWMLERCLEIFGLYNFGWKRYISLRRRLEQPVLRRQIRHYPECADLLRKLADTFDFGWEPSSENDKGSISEFLRTRKKTRSAGEISCYELDSIPSIFLYQAHRGGFDKGRNDVVLTPTAYVILRTDGWKPDIPEEDLRKIDDLAGIKRT